MFSRDQQVAGEQAVHGLFSDQQTRPIGDEQKSSEPWQPSAWKDIDDTDWLGLPAAELKQPKKTFSGNSSEDFPMQPDFSLSSQYFNQNTMQQFSTTMPEQQQLPPLQHLGSECQPPRPSWITSQEPESELKLCQAPMHQQEQPPGRRLSFFAQQRSEELQNEDDDFDRDCRDSGMDDGSKLLDLPSADNGAQQAFGDPLEASDPSVSLLKKDSLKENVLTLEEKFEALGFGYLTENNQQKSSQQADTGSKQNPGVADACEPQPGIAQEKNEQRYQRQALTDPDVDMMHVSESGSESESDSGSSSDSDSGTGSEDSNNIKSASTLNNWDSTSVNGESSSFNSSDIFHHDDSPDSPSPEPEEEKSVESEDEEANLKMMTEGDKFDDFFKFKQKIEGNLPAPESLPVPIEAKGQTPEKILRSAFDLKENGNHFFKKHMYQEAIARYNLVKCYTLTILRPKLGELQVIKTEAEIEQERLLREKKGATEDPRDPRNDQPQSMEDLESWSKGLAIPQHWQELPSKFSIFKDFREPSQREVQFCKEIQGQASLNMGKSYWKLKEFNKAIEVLRQSVDVDPTVKGFLSLMTCHETKKEYSLAKTAAKEALKIARALKNEAQCLELIKKIDDLQTKEAKKDGERLFKLRGFLLEKDNRRAKL